MTTNHGVVTANIIVNAAGAWADEIGRLAGVRPTGLALDAEVGTTLCAPGRGLDRSLAVVYGYPPFLL